MTTSIENLDDKPKLTRLLPETDNNSTIFPWSPTPFRKGASIISDKKKINTECDDLYPNCDVSVWLRSCEQEIIEPIEGTVTGIIPKWLNGALYRNGPGSIKVGDMEFKHLFDSSALLHRFAIQNGKVTYQCRFLQTDVYKKNNEAGRIVITEFGTASVPDPCQTIFNKISSVFKGGSDNAMISVYPFGDELYAFTEIPKIFKFNPDTLETEGKVNVSEHIGIVNHTSHPHVMPSGHVYNLGLSMSKFGPKHSIMCFPPAGDGIEDLTMFDQAYIVNSIPARWPLNPSYMHTFGITENYFIIVEQPLCVSVPSMFKARLNNEAFASALKWYPNEQTIINVLSRDTEKIKYKFYAEAFFYLHIINQYEYSNHIVIDICCYRDPAMLDCMYVETMKNMQKMPDYAKMFRGRPLRFVLPLDTHCKNLKVNPCDSNENDLKTNLINIPNTNAKAYKLANGNIFVVPELLCNLGCETPRINYEKYLGREYQYFYAISSDVDCDNPGTIIKVDVNNKIKYTWCEENCYPSEPIFVPNPNSQFEDDGIILAAMIWGHNKTNHVGLLILDAHTWQEIGRSEFETPGPTPKCLHGWFSDKHGSFRDKIGNGSSKF